jgi:hypothetical protein
MLLREKNCCSFREQYEFPNILWGGVGWGGKCRDFSVKADGTYGNDFKELHILFAESI